MSLISKCTITIESYLPTVFSTILNFKILNHILDKSNLYSSNTFFLKTFNLFYLVYLYACIDFNKSNVELQQQIIVDYYFLNWYTCNYLNLKINSISTNYFLDNYSILKNDQTSNEFFDYSSTDITDIDGSQNVLKIKKLKDLLWRDTTGLKTLSLYRNIINSSSVSIDYLETEISQRQLIFKNLGYLRLMQQEYMSTVFGEKLIFITNNYLAYIPLSFLKEQGLLLVSAFRFLKKTRVGSRLVAIVLSFLRFKDTELVMQAIIDTFEHMHYSKHKLLFRLWSYLITIFPKAYMNSYRVGGLKLEFRGKLAVGGNSKKRALLFKVGLNSNSSKITKTLLKQGVIRTATGVISCNLSIYY